MLQGELMAFGGVLVSYIGFIWVDMIIGLLGGIAAKHKLAHQHV